MICARSAAWMNAATQDSPTPTRAHILGIAEHPCGVVVSEAYSVVHCFPRALSSFVVVGMVLDVGDQGGTCSTRTPFSRATRNGLKSFPKPSPAQRRPAW